MEYYPCIVCIYALYIQILSNSWSLCGSIGLEALLTNEEDIFEFLCVYLIHNLRGKGIFNLAQAASLENTTFWQHEWKKANFLGLEGNEEQWEAYTAGLKVPFGNKSGKGKLFRAWR